MWLVNERYWSAGAVSVTARGLFQHILPRQETLPRQAARAELRIAVALGINSVSATQGNSIVPLYLPPSSVSVSSSRV
jgi:hypothetical protein